MDQLKYLQREKEANERKFHLDIQRHAREVTDAWLPSSGLIANLIETLKRQQGLMDLPADQEDFDMAEKRIAEEQLKLAAALAREADLKAKASATKEEVAAELIKLGRQADPGFDPGDPSTWPDISIEGQLEAAAKRMAQKNNVMGRYAYAMGSKGHPATRAAEFETALSSAKHDAANIVMAGLQESLENSLPMSNATNKEKADFLLSYKATVFRTPDLVKAKNELVGEFIESSEEFEAAIWDEPNVSLSGAQPLGEYVRSQMDHFIPPSTPVDSAAETPSEPDIKASAKTHPATQYPDLDQPESFPRRAAYLKAELSKRGISACSLMTHFNGPNHRTTKKVLTGKPVQEGVITRLAAALTASRLDRLDLPVVNSWDFPGD